MIVCVPIARLEVTNVAVFGSLSFNVPEPRCVVPSSIETLPGAATPGGDEMTVAMNVTGSPSATCTGG